MKRRNFLGLAGQSLALVAAAPALAPLATAAPVADSARRRAKLSRVLMDYGHVASHPPLVFGDGGLRMYHLVTGRTPREFKLSTPYDLSSAECEPDHTIEADV